MKWFDYKNTDNHTILYVPKDDITSYEVAKCLEILVGLFNWYNCMGFKKAKDFVCSYPENINRHFKIE